MSRNDNPILKEVVFEDNSYLTCIGEKAFYNCTKLTSIKIPNGVTFIGEYAFSFLYCGGSDFYDSNLSEVIFEENSRLDSIGSHAFAICTKLNNIEIPSGVTFIGEAAFCYCENLSTIYCRAENVPSLGPNVFYMIPQLLTIYVPENSLELYKAASQWKNHVIMPMVDIDEHYAETLNVYPNPSKVNSEINLGIECDRVEIYNIVGVKIAEYKNTDKIPSIETSGVYIIKSVVGNNIRKCRVSVK